MKRGLTDDNPVYEVRSFSVQLIEREKDLIDLADKLHEKWCNVIYHTFGIFCLRYSYYVLMKILSRLCLLLFHLVFMSKLTVMTSQPEMGDVITIKMLSFLNLYKQKLKFRGL